MIVEIKQTDQMRLGSRFPNYQGTFFIYGQILEQEVELNIGDKLYEETNQVHTYQIIDFPSVRKIPFKENHFHIIIKPKFIIDSIEDYIKTLEGRILCKQLNEVQDFS